MAKKSNVVDEPGSGYAPLRTQRVTRSQSVEPEPQPSVPTRNAASRLESTSRQAAAKRRQIQTVARPAELSTVLEDSDDDNIELARNGIDSIDADANADADDDDFRRVSTGSAFSGTTAKTSFSQEEIAELEQDVMLDVLPDLVSASDLLAAFLLPNSSAMPDTFWKDVRTGGSRPNKLYTSRVATINIHKPRFGSQEYVNPSIVLRALLDVRALTDVPTSARGAVDVLFAINLTQMMASLLVVCNPDQWTNASVDALKRLDASFPTAIAGGEYSREAFELSLALAVQVAIARLSSERPGPDFSPQTLIVDTLCDAVGDFKYTLGLKVEDAPDVEQQYVAQTTKRILDVLQASFAGRGGPTGRKAALEELKGKLSWTGLINNALEYYRRRRSTLSHRIQQEGGLVSIIENLSRDVQRRKDHDYINETRKSMQGKKSMTPKKRFDTSQDLAYVLQREIALTGQQRPAAHPPAPTAPMASQRSSGLDQPPIGEALEQDDGAFLRHRDNPQATARSTLAVLDNVQQAQATSSQARSGTQNRAPLSSAGTKRHYVDIGDNDEEFEPTQDEGFQTLRGDEDAADRRRRAVSLARAQHRSSAPSPATRRRKNPGSVVPPLPSPPSPTASQEAPRSTQFAEAKHVSRKTALVSRRQKPVQVRRPWSQEEDEALIEYIEELGAGGISYAHIKDEDDSRRENAMLRLRTAEDCRFKARNMKVTFLRSGVALPRNFDHVRLDAKAQRQLEAYGVEHLQEPIRVRSLSGVLGE